MTPVHFKFLTPCVGLYNGVVLTVQQAVSALKSNEGREGLRRKSADPELEQISRSVGSSGRSKAVILRMCGCLETRTLMRDG